MNIFAKHNWSTQERFLQIMQNKWAAHFISEVSICEAWYTMMMTIDLENLISLLNSDSWMSWW